MLDKFRDFANKRIVRLLFLLFLIIPFGMFGIDFYFKAPVGGDTVASVGPYAIGQMEFDNAIRQQADMYRQQFRGQFDASIMDNPEIRRAVLDRLVNEKLIALGADRSGIRLSDAQLAQRIAKEPFFQVDGRFNKDRYELTAKSQGLTPVGLDERLRQEFAQRQFRNSIAETAFVPKSTLDGFIKLSEQTREVSQVNLGPDAYLAKVKVTPEQVKAYYDSHAPEFTTPERARVEYVEMSLDAVAARTPVKPEDVKSVYEDQVKAGKLGQKEERRASHILIAVPADAKDADRKAAEAKAKEIADRVRKNPASFADVAKKESQDPGSAVQGGDLGFFARGAMVKPFEDAAFAAKKNEIVGPVKSDFGYHVIRVTDIHPEKVKSLAEAGPEIEANLKKQAAARGFADSAEQFNNIVYEQSTSLKPAAEQLNLAIQQSPWITKGMPSPVPTLGNPKLQAEIFSDNAIKAKRNTAAVEIAPNVLVAARILEHKPAELRPLDAVKAEIEKRLQREEAMKLATADGEAKLKELQAGKNPGVQWPAALAVNRQKPGGLMPQVIDKVFRVDARKLPAYVGVETPAGYSLVQVSKVIDIDKVQDAQRDALAARLRDAVAAEELESALGSLRDRVGVTVRKDALEKKAASN
ncbi:MAG: SurA N-terminal domain-containing protein [Usitatibacter sp.]